MNYNFKGITFDDLEKHLFRLIGAGAGIGIGVEKAVDQLPIPMPTATPTPRDIVVLTSYIHIKIDAAVKSQKHPFFVIFRRKSVGESSYSR